MSMAQGPRLTMPGGQHAPPLSRRLEPGEIWMKKKVLVTRAVFDETLAYLAQHFDVTSNQADAQYSAEQLPPKLQGMDAAVITTTERVDEALLARCPALRAVCSVSVGYNHIDLEACTRHGVMATNSPGVLTDSVADYAVCLTLATCRRLTESEACLRSGGWQGTHLKEVLGVDLHHATVGICGFGRIGQVIARRLRGFDPTILYYDQVQAPAGIERDLNAMLVDKDELLRQADIVILILPYTQQTHHFIGASELNLMKPKAVLINV